MLSNLDQSALVVSGGHVVDRVEKQRTNDRLLADQPRGGVSLPNPLECLVANRLLS